MRDLFNRLTLKAGALLILLLLSAPVTTTSQPGFRRIINIPDIPGYITLKCDFHMHTVFSDGIVWPTVRVQEAYHEGLDAIAISDHDDYAPHQPDIAINFHRPYEIALPAANAAGIILIPGLEISRHEPYGHHNAIFLTDTSAFPFWDNNATAATDTLASYRKAAHQGAFIFWNHPWAMPPLWKSDKVSAWTAAQDTIYGNGWLGGIEVVNGKRYDPNAHRWCIEKGLTMIGSTDIHNLTAYEYNLFEGGHRPMTLVFASERTLDGIKEALLSRRTAVYWEDNLIGDARYLKPIFEKSMTMSVNRVELAPGNRMTVLLSNGSCIPVTLERIPGETAFQKMIDAPQQLTIPAQRTVPVRIRRLGGQITTPQSGRLAYRVTNFLVAPEQELEVTLPVEIVIQPAK
jgi:3',5'-nucleoside bisphosphate phosphatase